jgi:ABC-type multidrug transport system ATPase subunit
VGRQPRLWLLDEPHAGLDHDARELLDDIVTEARAGGATVVLSSHELGSAGALADRVVHLAGGRVVAEPGHNAGVEPAEPASAELVPAAPLPAETPANRRHEAIHVA